jgi:hypothetical protein
MTALSGRAVVKSSAPLVRERVYHGRQHIAGQGRGVADKLSLRNRNRCRDRRDRPGDPSDRFGNLLEAAEKLIPGGLEFVEQIILKPVAQLGLPLCSLASSFVSRKVTVARNSRLEPRLATAIDAGGGIRHPRTVGKGWKEIGQLRIVAFGDEPRRGVASAPAARLADQVQERRLEVGQDDGAIARHGPDATAPARFQKPRRGQ